MRDREGKGRTIHQPVKGIEVHTGGDLTDSMSSLTVLHITIPPTGPTFSDAERDSVFAAQRGAAVRTLLDAKTFLVREPETTTEPSPPLSRANFVRRCRFELEHAEKHIASVSAECRLAIERAVDHALRLGILLATMEMRERHLEDVAREVEILKPARRRGAAHRRGAFKNDTLQICQLIHALITEEKHSVSNAARLVYKKHKLGTSPDANRKRYQDWCRRKLEASIQTSRDG